MTIRALPPEEWSRLEARFKANGSPLPSPRFAQIVVAEEAGDIVGLVTVQLVPHMEPIWVAPAFRGQQLWEPLLRKAATLLSSGTHFYAFHAHKGTEKIADTLGYTRHDWRVDEGIAP